MTIKNVWIFFAILSGALSGKSSSFLLTKYLAIHKSSGAGDLRVTSSNPGWNF